jgi:hypothetical protein
VNDVQMDAGFNNLGLDKEFIKKEIASDYQKIRPEAEDLYFKFNESGLSRSLIKFYSTRTESVGDILLQYPNASSNIVVKYFEGIDYKIPLVEISAKDMVSVISSAFGLRTNKIDIYIECPGNCSIYSAVAHVKLHGNNDITVDVKGSEMQYYFSAHEQDAFLGSMTQAQFDVPATPVEFLNYISFELMKLLNNCAYNVLRYSHMPERYFHASDTSFLEEFDLYGLSTVDACVVTLAAMKFMNSGKIAEVANENIPIEILSNRDQNILQYYMVREFADWKIGKDLDTVEAQSEWIDEQICTVNVPDTNRMGNLHRFLLQKLGKIAPNSRTSCPLKLITPN